MTSKQAIGIFWGIALVVSALWFWQTQTLRTAPTVSFKTIKGDTIELASLKDKPVMVAFWATDCPGCIEEIPHLIKLHQQYQSSGLTIIAVAMYYDPPNHVLAMADSKQLPYQIALDPSGTLARAFGNVQLTPTTFLIDKSGHIVMQKVGVFELSDMQRRIEQL